MAYRRMEELAHEASILHQLRSPYVPLLFALHIHEDKKRTGDALAYMVIEHANGGEHLVGSRNLPHQNDELLGSSE